MEHIALGEVMAQRTFELRGPAVEEREVVLQIGKPRPDPREGGDWICPYRTEGLGKGATEVAYGVDSLQALLLALQKAEAVLRHLSRQRGLKLTWLEHDDLGLTSPG